MMTQNKCIISSGPIMDIEEQKIERMVAKTQANSWWCPTIVNSSNEWLNSHESGYPIPGAPPPMLRIVKRVSLEDTL